MRRRRATWPALVLALASCVKPTKTNPNETRPVVQREGGRGWTVLSPPWSNIGVAKGSGVHTSAVVETEPFDSLVVSWNATIPKWAKGELQVCVRIDGLWRPPVNGHTILIAKDGALSSAPPFEDETLRLEVDTLRVKPPRRADAFRIGAAMPTEVEVRSLGIAHYCEAEKSARVVDATPSAAWGKSLNVKPRSQRSEEPALGPRICSPTATAMALEYLGFPIPTKDFAARVYDAASDLYGNWTINAARAGEIAGEAFVAHFDTFAEVEREIEAGRPVVLSHAWKLGELTGAPIPYSKGHLVVVAGFTADGDVVVNDPAAKPNEVRRVYSRRELFHTWQHNGSGIVYVFRPAPREPSAIPNETREAGR